MTELLFQVVLSGIAWFCLGFIVPNEPGLRVMGTICSSHKTLALGVPLISSMVKEGSPNADLYYLPLLMWHPMEIVVGSLLTSKFARWIVSENKRLETFSSHLDASSRVFANEERLGSSVHTTPKSDIESNDSDDDVSESQPVEAPPTSSTRVPPKARDRVA